jgi:poly(beta-D-mannuronate) lyase
MRRSVPTRHRRPAPLLAATVFGIASTVACGAAAAPAVPLVGSDTPLLDAALHEALLGAGIRPALREDLQRPVDPRLLRIETLGLEASGLFRGQRHEARSADEVQALSRKLKPGDQLILIGSNWKDASFTFGGEGTWEQPILIRADPSAAPFSGVSGVTFFGCHLVIMNLTFRNGLITPAVSDISPDEAPNPNGPVADSLEDVIRLGAGDDRPADYCIVNRLTLDNVNSARAADWPRIITRYLRINGHDNTVANSTFAHLKHYGEVIATGEPPSTVPQRLHVLNSRFIDRPVLDGDPCPYRYKMIQIGWGQLKAAPAGSLIQGNLFEDCASHVELISIKASDVFVRNNRFVRCPGAVVIRMGDRALIQANLFDGEGRPGTGGLRVSGRDHAIIGNTFARLHPTENHWMYPPPAAPHRYLAWTLSLVASDAEVSGTRNEFGEGGYGRAQDILIAHNRFDRNSGRFAFGSAPPSRSPRQFLPRNIRIEHNSFSGDGKGDRLFDYLAPDPDGAMASTISVYNNGFLP